jgi:hypothetical protein
MRVSTLPSDVVYDPVRIVADEMDEQDFARHPMATEVLSGSVRFG